MNILVLNSGSSSIKYNLWNMDKKKLHCKGLIEKIGHEDSSMKYKYNNSEFTVKEKVFSHADGIKLIFNTLTDKKIGILNNIKDINAVGHRVVHGGEKITSSEIVTPEIKKIIKECIALAPLHNPHNLEGIEAIEKILPGVPNVAVFDTAFHSSMPPKAYVYPLPYEFYEKHRIRKYGFHGNSHKYVAHRTADLLGIRYEKINCITCHLGNGSSLTAVNNGVSVNTTMGFTPLAGLPMGTRSGNIDPSIITYMIENLGYSTEDVSNIMNKESGFKGISGISSDMRDLNKAARNGNERAILTYKIFANTAKKYIGGLATEMKGRLDAVIFTGGIGENSYESRELICDGLEIFGAELDIEKNKFRGDERIISRDDSKVKIMVVPTNEELMIAMETQGLLNKTAMENIVI